MRGAASITIFKTLLLVLTALAGSAVPEGLSAEPAVAPVEKSHNSTGVRSRSGRKGQSRKLYHVDVTDTGEPCLPNPLWGNVVNPENYEFGCEEIDIMLRGNRTFVGNGHVRNVYLVEYEGRRVVVKTLRTTDDLKEQRASLKRHKWEMLTLDSMRGHRNIVGMLGVCRTTLVTEYYSNTFLGVIFRERQALPIRQVVATALDAARGLQALHEIAGAIHVDMKPQQLLVDDDGRVMLNDFNSAHIMSMASDGTFCPVQAGRRRRHTPWPAPENYEGQPLTPAADVYSMGMIFYSLIAGELPYGGDEALLDKAMLRKTRPPIDPTWHRGYMKVVQDMWHEDPQKRPTARRVVVRLHVIQEELKSEMDLTTSW